MEFMDLYKSKVNKRHKNPQYNILTETEKFYDDNFDTAPNYRRGKISHKPFDLNEDIDIRVSNIDNVWDAKRIAFRPRKRVMLGSYINYYDYIEDELDRENAKEEMKTALVFEMTNNQLSPYAKCKICNNTLKWKDETGTIHEMPCYLTNSSYGTKGVIDTTYIDYTDGKIACFIQDNTETRSLKLKDRFCFDKDGNQIYELVKSETLTMGSLPQGGFNSVRFMVLNKTNDYNSELDDVEHSLAYNKRFEENDVPVTVDYSVISSTGFNSVKKGDNNKFTLLKNGEPCIDLGWSITINDNGLVDLGWISITYGDLSIGENYVKIKNIKGYTNTTINILFENTNGDAVEISPIEIIAR